MSGSAVLGGEPLLGGVGTYGNGNLNDYSQIIKPSRYRMASVDDNTPAYELSDHEKYQLHTLQSYYHNSQTALNSPSPRFEFQTSGDQIRVSMYGGSLADQIKFATAVRPLGRQVMQEADPYYHHSSHTNIASHHSECLPSYTTYPTATEAYAHPCAGQPMVESPPDLTAGTSPNTISSISSIGPYGQRTPSSEYIMPAGCFTSMTSLPAPFCPSRALVGGKQQIDTGALMKAAVAGIWINPNYRGDINAEQLRNATTPSTETTSLIITGIPVSTCLKEIFALICEGKVFAFSTKPPIEGLYEAYAATLVFTTRQAAEAFKSKSTVVAGAGGIHIQGNRLRVAWNRDFCRPQPFAEKFQSRVVQFKGPQDHLSGAALEEYFRGKVYYDLVDGREWITPVGDRVIEFGFSCIRGQSRAAILCFRRDFIQGRSDGQLFDVQYAPDPCDLTIPHDPGFWWEGRRF